MSSEIKGAKEVQQKLRDVSNRARQLDGPHNVPILELLTPSFLSTCSRFGSVNEMFEASGFKIESKEDFKAIPEGEWDEFIKKHTSFPNWRQMLEAAAVPWTKNRLGL
jgi:hypothetical protein